MRFEIENRANTKELLRIKGICRTVCLDTVSTAKKITKEQSNHLSNKSHAFSIKDRSLNSFAVRQPKQRYQSADSKH